MKTYISSNFQANDLIKNYEDFSIKIKNKPLPNSKKWIKIATINGKLNTESIQNNKFKYWAAVILTLGLAHLFNAVREWRKEYETGNQKREIIVKKDYATQTSNKIASLIKKDTNVQSQKDSINKQLIESNHAKPSFSIKNDELFDQKKEENAPPELKQKDGSQKEPDLEDKNEEPLLPLDEKKEENTPPELKQKDGSQKESDLEDKNEKPPTSLDKEKEEDAPPELKQKDSTPKTPDLDDKKEEPQPSPDKKKPEGVTDVSSDQKPIMQEKFDKISLLILGNVIEADDQLKIKEFCQSLSNTEIVDIFGFCKKIEDKKQKERITEEIVKALDEEEILSVLRSLSKLVFGKRREQIDAYKTICEMMISACYNIKDEIVLNKLNIFLRDLVNRSHSDDVILFSNEILAIYEIVFNSCKSINQLYHIMYFIYDNLAINALNDLPFQIIYQKNLMNEFVEIAKLDLISEYLKNCKDPKIYFALKNALIKHKRYNNMLRCLDDKHKKMMKTCTETEFKEPIPIPFDFKFHTQIIDDENSPINITIYDIHTTKDNIPVYELKTDKDVKLGEISLGPRVKKLYVHHIKLADAGKKMRLQVLKALHEFAVRQSFQHKLNGQICLEADAYENSAANFLFGYRYPDTEKLAFTWSIEGEMKELIESYFQVKKSQKTTDEVITELEKLEKSLATNYYKNSSEMMMSISFDQIRKTAEKALGREPKNMQEVLKHGVYLDKNKRLENIVANDLLFDPEIGPLLEKYYEDYDTYTSQDEDEFLKELQAPQYHDKLQKIYEELTERYPGSKQPPNIKEALIYISDRKYNPIHYEGNMYLSDEKIEEWKKVLAIEVIP